jgi:alpha-D-ribose 1-methylphosphonate 5-triphosphate diphosphatase
MILTNCHVITPDRAFHGSLETNGGAIAQLSEGASGLSAAIDLEGHYLLPGCVELHTDNLEKHLQPRGSRWPALPALLAHDAQVAGLGITTVFNALCIGVDSDLHGLPRDFSQPAVEALRQAGEAGKLRADHFIHARCELPHPDTPSLLENILHHPRLRLASLMDHTPGQRQVADLDRFRRGLERMGPVADGWFENLVATERAKQERYAGPNRQQLVEMLRRQEVPLASHDDADEEHIAEAIRDGVTISEFPTTLTAAKAAQAAGMRNVMGAPNVVLGGSQSGNLAAMEAARHQVVDALSSDYAPVSLIHAAFAIARELELPLEQTVRWISANPASMAQLEDRGRIEPGLRADLVEVVIVHEVPCVVRVWREGVRVA